MKKTAMYFRNILAMGVRGAGAGRLNVPLLSVIAVGGLVTALLVSTVPSAAQEDPSPVDDST